MKIVTLDQVPFSQLVDCFNLAFSDYFVKFNASEEYLQNRWHGASVDFSLSAGVLLGSKEGSAENELVGFIVNGVGEWRGNKTAYNGGGGVIPSARGNGFTSKMYDFLKPKLKDAGVTCLTLEVIQENKPAIHLYEKAGLKIVRGLNCYSGEIKVDTSDLSLLNNAAYFFQKITTPDWALFSSFYDFEPAWENSAVAIQRNISDYECYIVYFKNQIIAFAIIKPATGYLPQFGVHKSFRKQSVGKFLFSELSKIYPKQKTNNVDASALHVISFLESIGYKNTINQYEMTS